MGLCLLLVELVVLYAPTVVFLWERWTLSVWHNAHGALVPPIVAFLVYHELKHFRGAGSSRQRLGVRAAVPALLLHAVDAGMHTQLLAAVSIVMALPGLSLLLIGARADPRDSLSACLPRCRAPDSAWHDRADSHAASLDCHCSGGLDRARAGHTGIRGGDDATPGDRPSPDLGRLQRLLHTLRCRRRGLAHGILDPRMEAKGVGAPGCGSLGDCGKHPPCRVTDGARHLGGPLGAHSFIHPLSGMLTFALALPIIFWLGGDPRRDGPIREAA